MTPFVIGLNYSRNLVVRPRADCCHVRFFLSAVIAGLSLMLAGRVTAQTFTTLYSFTEVSNFYPTNSDGAIPVAGLILSDSTLYGTANIGGIFGRGTVFKVN